MEQFQRATAALGLKEGDELFTQAGNLWEMMDDMARSNPEGYQNFIKKQMNEKAKMEAANAAPTPVYAVRAKDSISGKIVWINFSKSDRVKPQTPDGAVPIVVVKPVETQDATGNTVTLYEAAFHPDVLKEATQEGPDGAEYKRQLTELGVECVEQRSAQIEGVDTVKLKRDYRLKDKPLKTLSLFEKMERAKKEMERETAAPLDMKLPADASPAAGVTRGGAARPKTPSTDDPGGSLLEQLGAIAGCGTSAAENAGAPGSHEPEIHIAGLTTKSDGAVAAKSGLIEVVPPEVTTPSHTLDCDDAAKAYELKVLQVPILPAGIVASADVVALAATTL